MIYRYHPMDTPVQASHTYAHPNTNPNLAPTLYGLLAAAVPAHQAPTLSIACSSSRRGRGTPWDGMAGDRLCRSSCNAGEKTPPGPPPHPSPEIPPPLRVTTLRPQLTSRFGSWRLGTRLPLSYQGLTNEVADHSLQLRQGYRVWCVRTAGFAFGIHASYFVSESRNSLPSWPRSSVAAVLPGSWFSNSLSNWLRVAINSSSAPELATSPYTSRMLLLGARDHSVNLR